jgi:hypothetical protein
LKAAVFRSDSANVPINLATVDVSGAVGDTVAIAVLGDASVVEAAGPAARITVNVDGASTSYPLADLRSGVTILRLAHVGATRISYRLTRVVVGVTPGAFQVVQKTNAAVIRAETPWAYSDSPGASPSSSSTLATAADPLTCNLLFAATGVCGSTTYTISPYVTGSPFCCFQSDPGNGFQHPITITFSKAIASISMTITDPTYPGNTMTAYGPTGEVVGSATFAFSGQPGVYTTDTQTLSGAISSVVLTPNDSDYVAYAGSFQLPVPVFTVTASKDSPFVGDTVTYTAGASDGVTPFTVTGWSWVPDPAFSARPPTGYVEKLKVSNCGRTAVTCRHTPGSSGTIVVYGKFNSKVDSAKKHIDVTLKSCPPDGDLLDSAEVRRALKQVWIDSHAEQDTIVANHAEYTWGVYRLSDGSIIAQPVTFAGTPCGSDPVVPDTVGSTRLVATIHPHPFLVGQIYPASCGTLAGQHYDPKTNTAVFGGRASTEDWLSSDSLSQRAGHSIPGYVIDYDGIDRYDGSNAGIQTLANGVIVVTKAKTTPGVLKTWPRFDPTRVCGRP